MFGPGPLGYQTEPIGLISCFSTFHSWASLLIEEDHLKSPLAQQFVHLGFRNGGNVMEPLCVRSSICWPLIMSRSPTKVIAVTPNLVIAPCIVPRCSSASWWRSASISAAEQ